MNPDILAFLAKRPQALPLYEALEEKIFALDPDTTVKVSKTQISFSARRMFACVSFLPCRRGPKPPVWLTLTLGLDHRLDSPRVDAASEPYPGRWTHHFLLSDPQDLDGQLLGWLREAHDFSARKR